MLTILGLVGVVVATYFVYKTAKDTGRNAAVWGLLTFAVGFGIQIIVPLLIGVIIGIIKVSSGSTVEEIQRDIQSPAIIIGIVCLVLSFAGIALIIRHVSKIPEEKSVIMPPSPPDFK
jgi:uncharacterized membrane protein